MNKPEEIALEDRIDPGLRVGEKEDVDTTPDIVDVQAVEEAHDEVDMAFIIAQKELFTYEESML